MGYQIYRMKPRERWSCNLTCPFFIFTPLSCLLEDLSHLIFLHIQPKPHSPKPERLALLGAAL